MPVFGEYETNDEPLAVTPTRNHTTTVWLARKGGGADGRQYAIKLLAVHRDARAHSAEDHLGADPGLEFIETVKQLKKAESEGARDFAQIHAFGTSDLGCWYATDYCVRGSLKTWINLQGGVDSAAVRRVVSCMAEGCRSLKRICRRSHGNLKPSNVLLSGKTRPLRSTPLLMVDPMPISATQLAGMASDDRTMVQNIFEAQDLRAIGEMVLQLVEGRLVESGFDYNFPIQSSPSWQKLGKDESRWRDLCNRLIDPQLDLQNTNLDWLAKEFPAGSGAQKLLIPLAASVVLIAAGSGIYFYAAGGFQRHFRAAEAARTNGNLIVAAQEIRKALKAKPDDPRAIRLSGQILDSLLESAQKEAASADWPDAKRDMDQAGAIKPDDSRIESLADQIQRGQAYQAAMQAGEQALQNKNYDEAARQAGLALQDFPRAPAAVQLQTEAADAKRAAAAEAAQEEARATQAREQSYSSAMRALRRAINEKNYDEAIRQADTALEYKPGDAGAVRLKSQAENAMGAAAARAAEIKQGYQSAMQAGHNALQNKNYSEAVRQAKLALQDVPGDAEASRLESEAEADFQAAASAQARQQQYESAMVAGQSALSQHNYAESLRQAQIALQDRPGDSDATKLQNEAQAAAAANAAAEVLREKYDAAMNAGRAALSNKDYNEAVRQADIALGIEPGSSQANQLKNDARAQAQAAANAQARQTAYQAAMAAAHDALKSGKYDAAIAEAKVALTNEPGDAEATRLEADAQAQARAVADAAARRRNYTAAMTAGHAAYSKRQYSQAVSDADTALANAPGDAQATQLKNDAQGQLDAAAAAQARQQQYQSAMTAGNSALAAGKYADALQQAKTALTGRPGDAAAAKLENDAQAGLYHSYIAAGNADLAKGNYQEALQYAKAAAGINQDDPAAKDLETKAESAQKAVTQLDGELSILMKRFGVDQERGSTIAPSGTDKKITEIDDPRVVTQYLMLTTNLEAAYLKGGWLDQQKRRTLIDHVRRNLNNY